MTAKPEIKCRFGCSHPIAIYHVPRGCVCWPDPIQALCMQHAIKAQSLGPITRIMRLDEGAEPWVLNGYVVAEPPTEPSHAIDAAAPA